MGFVEYARDFFYGVKNIFYGKPKQEEPNEELKKIIERMKPVPESELKLPRGFAEIMRRIQTSPKSPVNKSCRKNLETKID